jgi:hypothetical protein
MLQTDTQGHTTITAMLKVWIFFTFPSHTANHYAAYTAVLSVWVRWVNLLNQLTEIYDTGMSYF